MVRVSPACTETQGVQPCKPAKPLSFLWLDLVCACVRSSVQHFVHPPDPEQTVRRPKTDRTAPQAETRTANTLAHPLAPGHARNKALVAVCILAGIGVLIYGLLNVAGAIASRSWPTATGQVTASTVTRGSSGGGGTTRSSGYKPHVEYTYRVGERDHHGSRIAFGNDIAKSQSHARQIADRYAVGTAVEVAYDPNDPANSALETGLSLESFAVPGFGVVLIGAGIAFLLWKDK
jgi:Protein of unknown function (DUF3592)